MAGKYGEAYTGDIGDEEETLALFEKADAEIERQAQEITNLKAKCKALADVLLTSDIRVCYSEFPLEEALQIAREVR